MPYSLAVYSASKKFLKQYGLGVAEAIKGTGLYFPAVMAQSALESGYGKKIPEGSNNFGGIKYTPNLPGVVGYVNSDTTEYTKAGKAYKTVEKFAKFKDVESGFRAHIKVLLGDRYKNARLNAISPEQQILMIAKSGYTTGNPAKYLSSMKGIIEAMRDISQLGRISN
jgi:flagellum-specific peptidoglycan hydrolase FlgJ